MNDPRVAGLSRRAFFKVSTVAGVSLTVGIYLAGCESGPEPLPTATATLLPAEPPAPTLASTPAPTLAPEATPVPTATPAPEPEAGFEPNIYLTIDQAGTVTVRAFRSELGQGIRTAIAMLLADELDVDWAAVRIEQSPTSRTYGNQVTGGSVSVSSYYDILRQAGATARHMLVAAAAQGWDVDVAACRTESGQVIHPDGRQRLAYGELIGAAAGLPEPGRQDVQLKDAASLRYIGKPMTLYDAPAMVRGTALFASDVRLPGMLYATVARCPVFGGKLAGYDDARARAVPGVRDVVTIRSGVAVVADSTWAALQGRAALDVTWDEGIHATWSSESIRQQAAAKAPKPGDAAADDAAAVDAAYDIPYLAHATMEPMACVADVRADACEVWAPSQDPQAVLLQATAISTLPEEAVTVHVPLVGGAFGRRHATDFAVEALEVSRAVAAPVKVFWTREDDLQHDFYHPLNYLYVRATLDAAGRPTGLPRVRPYPMAGGVPTGYWRSVENFPEAFARECFLDEIAAARGIDPLELRRPLLPDRARAVLELAAEKAGWGSPPAPGLARGRAYPAPVGVTHVADVAEVSVDDDGRVRVHRVVCAVDCGLAVNPDTVAAQMEGGIAFGLTAALRPGVVLENGRIKQGSLAEHPLLRLDEMPVVEVHIVPSEARPTGVGEMGVPPIAPAVANAVYAATGIRVRHIPILPADLKP